jgi:hypothetical protein
VDRREGNHHLDCGAVRIGDEASVRFQILGVDFRDHEGNLGIHPEVGPVIDADGSPADGLRGVGDGGSLVSFGAGEQDDLLAFQRLRGDGPNLRGTAVDVDAPTRSGKNRQGPDGKLSLMKNAQKLHSDRPDADNADVVGLHKACATRSPTSEVE